MIAKSSKSAGDPSDIPPATGVPLEQQVVEPPPPPRPDPIAIMRNRLAELQAQRTQKLAELERMAQEQLAPYDLAINEINNILTQLGQVSMTVELAPVRLSHSSGQPMGVVGPTGALNVRQIAAQHPLSGAAILKRQMGKSG